MSALTGQKSATSSKTVWGGVAAIFGGLAVLAGAWANDEFNPEVWVPALMSMGGGAYSIYGRIVARQKIE